MASGKEVGYSCFFLRSGDCATASGDGETLPPPLFPMLTVLNRFRPLFLLMDVGLTLLALFGGAFLRTHISAIGLPVDPMSAPAWVTAKECLAAIAAWGIAFHITGVHQPRTIPDRKAWRTILMADLLGTGVFLSLLFFLKVTDFSRVLVAYAVALAMAFHLARHMATRLLLSRVLRPFAQKILLVGEGEMGTRLVERITENQWGMKIVGGIAPHGPLEGLPRLGKLIDLPDIVKRHGIDVVIIALPASRHELVGELVMRLQSLPVRIDVVPDLLNLTLSRAAVEDFFGLPLVGLREPPIDLWGRILKRAFDFCAAALGILLASPAMLAVMAAIRIYDGGPVFFRQRRVGENGRTFDMLKFRSMVVDAESRLKALGIDREKLDKENPVFKLKNDPRITPVGRFIRRWSLDELPQLINVLKGDMSLVGPRPEDAKVVARYSFYLRKRLAVKPGLTGPMQVNGRGDLPMQRRLSLELDYIDHWSVWTDLKIILLTVPAVLSGKGAY